MKSVFAILASAALALAQAIGPLAINDFPIDGVVAGTKYAITYTAPDQTAPVTFILKNGAANDLQTVNTLGSATGGHFEWTPSVSLPNGNYAVQISQGEAINYMGLFPLTGGSLAVSTTSSTVSSSSTVTSSVVTSATLPTVTSPSTTSPAVPVGTGNTRAPAGTGNVGTVTRSPTATPTTGGKKGDDQPAPFDGAAAGLSVSIISVGVAALFGALALFA